MFIDKLRLFVQAGSGGKGCESYFRRTDKKIVPNGGNGGTGGRVIVRAAADAPLLSSLCGKRHVSAENGGHGGSDRKHGRNGRDLVIVVPCGTRVYDMQRNFVIRENMSDQEEVIVLEGGQGGRGNAGGKKATPGERKDPLEIELRTFIPADVFFVGLPGSGKSKLLNALTHTRLPDATYPFATKKPEIGVCQFFEDERLTLCELPSLYRGSHEGRGMGNDFLKHLERAKFVIYLVNPVSEFAGSLAEGLEILRNEIGVYRKSFLEIPSAVVVNKIDLPEAGKKQKIEVFKPKGKVFYISAVTEEGMPSFLRFLKKIAKEFAHA